MILCSCCLQKKWSSAEVKEFKALMRREYTLVTRTLFIYVRPFSLMLARQ